MTTVNVARFHAEMMRQHGLCLIVDTRKGAKRPYQLVNRGDEPVYIMRHEDAVALSELCFQTGYARRYDTHNFICFIPLPLDE